MRAVVMVIDSFGIGALPDAAQYGDEGANTARHICEQIPGQKWPNLKQLGLGNAAKLIGHELPGCEAVSEPSAWFGVMDMASPGKDTTSGHWEIAGIELDRPFETFPQGYPSFPEELVAEFTRRTGRKILGNRAASGTQIIQELGDEHVATGRPICYTSADSVFQIAAHEEVIPPEDLYEICSVARELCDPYRIARVIARPFTGTSDNYTRTKNRKDFSIALPGESLMEHLQRHGVNTVGVGKIGNIFAEQGLTENFPDKGNPACLDRTAELLKRNQDGNEFIFINLVDTDMIYGHRRDVRGYFDAVSKIDERIPAFLELLDESDLFIVTADHGCDPTWKGSDHTREYIPLLAYQKRGGKKQGPGSVGIRESHSDIAATVSKLLTGSDFPVGRNFFGSA
ncbi:MAG: phosphopentomutase [Spirochaetales bacterium]|nr:phosphopentomutase [Spirochaetales bacterium]